MSSSCGERCRKYIARSTAWRVRAISCTVGSRVLSGIKAQQRQHAVAAARARDLLRFGRGDEVAEVHVRHRVHVRVLGAPLIQGGAHGLDLLGGHGALEQFPGLRLQVGVHIAQRVDAVAELPPRSSHPRGPCGSWCVSTTMSSALVTGFGPVAIVYAVVVCCTSQFWAARRSRGLWCRAGTCVSESEDAPGVLVGEAHDLQLQVLQLPGALVGVLLRPHLVDHLAG